MLSALRRLFVPAAAASLGLAACVALAVPDVGAAVPTSGTLPFGCSNPANHTSIRLLPAATGSTGSRFTCFGKVVLGAGSLAPHAATGPVGYGPAQIQAAYKIAGKRSYGRTVAVVLAYDNPNAEADLAVYRSTFKLPPCTTANGCFRKVNQYGAKAPLPRTDYGWAQETSLDLDAVSATCPDCRILLVEASSPTTGPLMAAVDTAARLGAVAINNSYGGDEDGSILAADRHLNHPGVAVVASAGDDGYGVQWPASSRYAVAVGGTTLTRSSGNTRGWTERAWSGSGSGCSRYEPKPSWQLDKGCARRTVADTAAVADPGTGLAVYDTYNNCGLLAALLGCDNAIAAGTAQGLNGWAKIGGTSLSSPIVAAMYALAGNKAPRQRFYSNTRTAYRTDVTSGANGRCSVTYLCTARRGYDGPTGMGTPLGLGAL